jgi:hypothetical protein
LKQQPLQTTTGEYLVSGDTLAEIHMAKTRVGARRPVIRHRVTSQMPPMNHAGRASSLVNADTRVPHRTPSIRDAHISTWTPWGAPEVPRLPEETEALLRTNAAG